MQHDRLLIIGAVLAVTIATLHISAINFFLYWKFPWLDIPIHIMGGLLVSLLAIWFYLEFHTDARDTTFSIWKISMIAVSAIAVVGIGWELFELWAGAPKEENFVIDTVVDLSMDFFGAFLSVVYVKQFHIEKVYDARG